MDFILNKHTKPSFEFAKKAFNWLLPERCLGCSKLIPSNEPYLPLCKHCMADLPYLEHYCLRCGQKMPKQADYCGHCLSHHCHFDHFLCAFAYQDIIQELIRQLKYKNKPEIAKPLGFLLAETIKSQCDAFPDLILPVPIHKTKLRQRGYNQAHQLAKQISQILDIPLCNQILEKTRDTLAQADLALKQRALNVKGTFSVNKSLHAKNVAIIDDVVTTGATVTEIAKILRKNGVHCIHIWGVAQTEK